MAATTNQLIFLRDNVLPSLIQHQSARFLQTDASLLSVVAEKLQTNSYKCADQCLEELDLLLDESLKKSKKDLGDWNEVKKLESDYLNMLKGMPLQEVAIDTTAPVPNS